MSLGSYLLGIALLAVALGPLAWGASRLRARLVPEWSGATARLADVVVFLTLLLWCLEAMGSVGLFRRAWIVAACVLVGGGVGILARPTGSAAKPAPIARSPWWASATALFVVAVLGARWIQGTRLAFVHGLTNNDSLRYHLPQSARFVQTGWITNFVYTVPENVEHLHPANSELLHAFGMALFGRDLVSPLHALAWLAVALLGGYCIGRPWGNGPFTLVATGVILATPVIAGTASATAFTDVPSITLFLASVAFLVQPERSRWSYVLAGAAAGLAVGSKATVIVPVVALTAAVAVIAGKGRRWPALRDWLLALITTGSFWYLRNLVHSGSPLPSVKLGIGPLAFPTGQFTSVDRFRYSVMDYVTDGDVWRDWYLPGLRDSIGLLWWLVIVAGVLGVVCAATAKRQRTAQALAGVVVVGAAFYLVAPSTALGPHGRPIFFYANLRFLYPALVLALVIPFTLPLFRRGWRRATALVVLVVLVVSGLAGETVLDVMGGSSRDVWKVWPGERRHVAAAAFLAILATGIGYSFVRSGIGFDILRSGVARRLVAAGVVVGLVVLIVAGFRVQKVYFENRYPEPVDAWANTVHDERIAFAFNGFPLYAHLYGLSGEALDNSVQWVGRTGQNGAFHYVRGCREWRRALRDGRYDYVVYARTVTGYGNAVTPERWTADDPAAELVLRVDDASVYRLDSPPDPTRCGAGRS